MLLWKHSLAPLVGLLVTFGGAVSANAALIGANVHGTLGFNYPPGTGQFWNPQNVVVSPGIEYYYSDNSNVDEANFSNTQLIISDNVLASSSGWLMSFQSPAFLGAAVSEVSDNFTFGGVNFNTLGDTLTFTWGGTGFKGQLTAVYDITPASVPEPATLSVFGFGLAGLGFMLRRRKRT